MTTNQKIADALRKCKRHLWDGTGRRGNRCLNICTALEATVRDGVTTIMSDEARRIVMARLRPGIAPMSTVALWLQAGGYISRDDYIKYVSHAALPHTRAPKIVRQIQAYRHAWVDSLIEEFSK